MGLDQKRFLVLYREFQTELQYFPACVHLYRSMCGHRVIGTEIPLARKIRVLPKFSCPHDLGVCWSHIPSTLQGRKVGYSRRLKFPGHSLQFPWSQPPVLPASIERPAVDAWRLLPYMNN